MVPTKVLKCKNIIANPSLRKPTETSIEAMARSMTAIGQLSPVGAIESEKGNLLLYGNTRFYAAEKLGWESLEVKIYPIGTPPEECLRISISENSVRQQMNFVQEADALHEYAALRKISLKEAGLELNLNESKISKCLKTNERLTTSSKKKLLAAGFGGSLAYLISQEPKETQPEFVDRVIAEKWSRKQLEQYFRQKKQGVTKFEFRKDGAKLVLDIPKLAKPEKVLALLKAFAAELKKNCEFDLATAARRIREQANVVS